MHEERCVCDLLPHLEVRTRIVVVMHHREWHKTTGTAHLFALAVPGSEIRLRGGDGESLDLSDLAAGADPTRRPLVLFPSEDASPLTPDLVAADPRPATLVVPDGSWRQAGKIPRREAALRDLPRVRLVDDAPSAYRLRTEPHPGGLATFEAMARALAVLEGPENGPRLRALLETAFEAMVERTLQSRGTPIAGASDSV